MPLAQQGLALNDVYDEVFTQVVFPCRPGHLWIPAARPMSNPFTLAASKSAVSEYRYRVYTAIEVPR